MEATSGSKHVDIVDIEHVDIKIPKAIEEGGQKVFNMEVQKLRWLSLITVGLVLFGTCLNVVMLGLGMRGTTWHVNHNEAENSNPPKMFPQLKSCAHDESWLAEHDESGNIQESIVDQDETIMMLDSIKDGVTEFSFREAGHVEFIKVIRLDEVTSDGAADYFPLRATESDGRLNQNIVILCRDEPASANFNNSSRCHMFIPAGESDEHEISTQIHLADNAQRGVAYQVSISTEVSDVDLGDDNGNVTDDSTTGRQLADSDGNTKVRLLARCRCMTACHSWGWHRPWCYTSGAHRWWPHHQVYYCGKRTPPNSGFYHGRYWSDGPCNSRWVR